MPPREVKEHLVIETTEQRAANLREELAYHEHRYHVLDYPLISSRRYLAMRAELAELEQRGVRVSEDSASLRKGVARRSHFERAQHVPPWPEPAGVRSPAELRRHIDLLTAREGQAPVCIGLAWMAGVPVSLTYIDGSLRRALIRGEGIEGDDVTDNIRTIGSVPLKLRPPGTITESRVTRLTRQAIGPSTTTPVPPFPAELTVRGLVTMRNVDLQALDRQRIDAGEAPYVAQDAAILSSLRRLDPRITASRRLRLFAFDVAEIPIGIETSWQIFGALKSWGFAVTSLTWRCEGFEEILDFIGALQQEKARFEFPLAGGLLATNRLFPIDPEPPRLVALSFTNPGRRARVQTVYRAVGRTGAVLPVALIVREGGQKAPDGVPIPARSGTEMLELGEGAMVRALPGGIAPVLEVEFPGAKVVGSGLCPACGAQLRRPADEPFDACDNLACKGRQRSRLLHLIGPRGLGLKALNPRIAEALFQQSSVSLADLFALEPDAVDRVSPGSGAAFATEIKDASRLPVWKMLYLSCIPGVGERAARLIASQVLDADGLLALSPHAVGGVSGLTPEAADGLARWLMNDARHALERLSSLGVQLVGEDECFAAPFAERKVVLAGKLESLTLEQAVDEVERRGGTVNLKISRKTNLVIVGKDAAEAVRSAEAYGASLVEEPTLVGFLRLTQNV